jgi:hypothetical protein
VVFVAPIPDAVSISMNAGEYELTIKSGSSETCSVSVEEARIGNLMKLVGAADGQWSDKFGTKGSILSTAEEN